METSENHIGETYTQNIHNSSTLSHPSEEENRKRAFEKLSVLNTKGISGWIKLE
jgi:hypothetical protein